MHGGVAKENLKTADPAAVAEGCSNLKRHIENLRKFGVPVVVAINKFITDTDAEVQAICDAAVSMGAEAFVCTHWSDGGAGTAELAKAVSRITEQAKSNFTPLYPDTMPLREKVKTIAKEIYRADDISCDASVETQFKDFEKAGFGHFPVCMAKTQMSLSADPAARGAPSGHTLNVREVRLANGAGFVVAICGDMMTMPGLPKVPAAERIDIDEHGKVSGLF